MVLVVQSVLAAHLILVHPRDLGCLEDLLDQASLAVLGVPLGLSSPLDPGFLLSPWLPSCLASLLFLQHRYDPSVQEVLKDLALQRLPEVLLCQALRCLP